MANLVSKADGGLPASQDQFEAVGILNAQGQLVSPVSDHTIPTDPSSVRLSNGSSFYNATTPSDTQPVSAVSLPLPTGAATAARQDTGNTSLSSIDGKLNSLGQKTSVNSVPVVIASDQSSIDVNVSSIPLPTGAATEAKQDVGNTSLASIDGKIPASPSQEHTTAISPSSVRLTDGSAFYKATTPSDTQPVSAASLPLPSGAATSANQSTIIAALPAALTGSGNFKVALLESSATITISGTVAATQSGAWDITSILNALPTGSNTIGAVNLAQYTPATGRLPVDGSGVTQPISAASLPLPSGAATSAKQDTIIAALPTALTVSGNFKVSLEESNATQAVSGTVAATQSGNWSVRTQDGAGNLLESATSSPAGTERGLIVRNIPSGTQAISAASLPLPAGAATAAKQPALGTAGTPSSDVITVQGITSMTALKVDGSAVTQPVSGSITPIPSASATGLSQSLTDAQVATVTTVKGSSGRVYGYHIANFTSANAFLQFYDISGAVTVGSSTRTRTIFVPPNGAVDGSFGYGLTFANAVKTAATTTITGNTAPSTGLLVNIDYI